jgi:SAM-dependent methyltransferase
MPSATTASPRKRAGAHFTPPELSGYVASRLAAELVALPGHLCVVDPAAGDGNLLSALADAMPPSLAARTKLVGVESDPRSFDAMRERLGQGGDRAVEFRHGDFLDRFAEPSVFSSSAENELVDAIIANPPYVRTQVLGAARAQVLAERFGLTGRVDLYHAFVAAMTRSVRPGGVIALITSNRFLTTRGGSAIRGMLRRWFDPIEVVDLGDTKLFDAAVLPALFFGRRRANARAQAERVVTRFTRVYESFKSSVGDIATAQSVCSALSDGRTGLVATPSGTYAIAVGRIDAPEDEGRPWALLTTDEADWVSRLQRAAACRVGDVARIRVGIKTTADRVFIRSDWEELDENVRPEPQYLHPLLSQRDAAPWCPVERGGDRPRILYTHEVVAGRRRPIQFPATSAAWQYLLGHKDTLSARHYVIEAGREWYEIWVPQDPLAWTQPKLVFPDISPDARFFLDADGSLVDGNCYWITPIDQNDRELLPLIMAVANSALLARFHDLAFQNKLYSQRKRFLTQYVQEYPLPRRDSPAAIEATRLARELCAAGSGGTPDPRLVAEIDRLVAAAFGLDDCSGAAPTGLKWLGRRSHRRTPSGLSADT